MLGSWTTECSGGSRGVRTSPSGKRRAWGRGGYCLFIGENLQGQVNKFNYIKIEMCTAKNEDFKNQSDEKTASVELI